MEVELKYAFTISSYLPQTFVILTTRPISLPVLLDELRNWPISYDCVTLKSVRPYNCLL